MSHRYIPRTINTTIDSIARTRFNERKKVARNLPWSRMTPSQRQAAVRLFVPHKDRPHA